MCNIKRQPPSQMRYQNRENRGAESLLAGIFLGVPILCVDRTLIPLSARRLSLQRDPLHVTLGTANPDARLSTPTYSSRRPLDLLVGFFAS